MNDFIKQNILASYGLNLDNEFEDRIEKGKKAAIGEVREWQGEKQQKQADGSWKKVSEGKSKLPFGLREETEEETKVEKIKEEVRKHVKSLDEAKEKGNWGRIEFLRKKIRSLKSKLPEKSTGLSKAEAMEILGVVDYESLEKGKKAALGEIRVWKGEEWIKTNSPKNNGWQLKSKMTGGGSAPKSEESSKPVAKKESKPKGAANPIDQGIEKIQSSPRITLGESRGDDIETAHQLTLLVKRAPTKYKTNDQYHYGEEFITSKGKKEKGYVAHIVEVESTPLTKEESIATFHPDDQEIITDMFPDTSKVWFRREKFVSQIRREVGISSKENAYWISFGLGESRLRWQMTDPKSFKKDAARVMKVSKELFAGKEKSEKDLKEFISDNYSKLPVLSKKESSSSSDIGIGRHSSTRVSYKINKEYDLRPFVKKHGLEKLKSLVKGTWFENKIKNISTDGIVSTDESWTDVYD